MGKRLSYATWISYLDSFRSKPEQRKRHGHSMILQRLDNCWMRLSWVNSDTICQLEGRNSTASELGDDCL